MRFRTVRTTLPIAVSPAYFTNAYHPEWPKANPRRRRARTRVPQVTFIMEKFVLTRYFVENLWGCSFFGMGSNAPVFILTGTSSRMAVIQLINLGITQVLVKLLINLQHADTITSEVLTQDILWILGQVIFWRTLLKKKIVFYFIIAITGTIVLLITLSLLLQKETLLTRYIIAQQNFYRSHCECLSYYCKNIFSISIFPV